MAITNPIGSCDCHYFYFKHGTYNLALIIALSRIKVKEIKH